jgi:hypothetical protein
MLVGVIETSVAQTAFGIGILQGFRQNSLSN